MEGTMTTFKRFLLLLLIPAVSVACSDSGGDGGGPTDPPGGNEAPSANINTPAEGATFAAGEAVLFQGFGTDPEDGAIPSADLSWSSDVSGHVGDGSAFNSSTLAEGSHVITLTATDSEGAEGTASVSVTIEAALVLDITGTWTLTGDNGTVTTGNYVQTGASVTGNWTSTSGSEGTATLTLIGQDLTGQINQTVPDALDFDVEAVVDESGASMEGSYTSIGLGDFNFTVIFSGSLQP